MTKSDSSPQEKKLKNLRKILTIVFTGIALPTLLCGTLALPVSGLMRNDPGFSGSSTVTPAMLLVPLGAGLLILISLAGAICLMIYYIFKYRLEKGEDLFI